MYLCDLGPPRQTTHYTCKQRCFLLLGVDNYHPAFSLYRKDGKTTWKCIKSELSIHKMKKKKKKYKNLQR